MFCLRTIYVIFQFLITFLESHISMHYSGLASNITAICMDYLLNNSLVICNWHIF